MADTSLIIAVLILQSSFLYFSTSVNQEHPAFELTEHTLVFQTRHSLPMLRWLMATLTNAHTCTSTLSTGPWLSQPPWKAWSSKSALVKWSKRGITTVFIPGHDPPLDITVFKDVSTNPGPCIEPAKVKAVNMVNMDNSGNKTPIQLGLSSAMHTHENSLSHYDHPPTNLSHQCTRPSSRMDCSDSGVKEEGNATRWGIVTSASTGKHAILLYKL